MTFFTGFSSLEGFLKGVASTSKRWCLMVIFSRGGWLGQTTSLFSLVQLVLVITQDFFATQNGSQNIQRNGHLLISLSWTLAIWCTLLSSIPWYGLPYRHLVWSCLFRSQNHQLKTYDRGWSLFSWHWAGDLLGVQSALNLTGLERIDCDFHPL